MKPVHIVVLLLAGALGGALIMKGVHPSKPAFHTAVVTAPVVQPPPVAQTPPPAPEPAPAVAAEPLKPSPMPPPVKPPVRREVPKPRPIRTPAPVAVVHPTPGPTPATTSPAVARPTREPGAGACDSGAARGICGPCSAAPPGDAERRFAFAGAPGGRTILGAERARRCLPRDPR